MRNLQLPVTARRRATAVIVALALCGMVLPVAALDRGVAGCLDARRGQFLLDQASAALGATTPGAGAVLVDDAVLQWAREAIAACELQTGSRDAEAGGTFLQQMAQWRQQLDARVDELRKRAAD